jgi:hypothetical protein
MLPEVFPSVAVQQAGLSLPIAGLRASQTGKRRGPLARRSATLRPPRPAPHLA